MQRYRYFVLALLILAGTPFIASAASLSVAPTSGTFSVGDTIAVKVLVTSTDASTNSIAGVLSFPPSMFTVQSVSEDGSIIGIWTTDPSVSRSAGTITFAGLSLSGYTGTDGLLFSVILKATHAGSGDVSFSSGQIFASDGSGTDLQKGLNGATFTIQSPGVSPAAVLPSTKAPDASTASAMSQSDNNPTSALDTAAMATTSATSTGSQLDAPLISGSTNDVAYGSYGQVTGSSSYPGAIVQLTLADASGLNVVVDQAVVQSDGSYVIGGIEPNVFEQYSGSVTVKNGDSVSPASAPISMRFEPQPWGAHMMGVLQASVKPLLMLLLAAIVALIIYGAYRYSTRRVQRSRDTLYEVDGQVQESFAGLRTRLHASLLELMKASRRRKLSAPEKRFVDTMAETIRETEDQIEEYVRHSEAE